MHTSVWQLDLLVRKEDWFVLIFLSSVVMVQSINTCRSHGGPNTTTYVRFVITGLSTWTRYAYMARLALAACLHLLRSCHNAVRAALRVACQAPLEGRDRCLCFLSACFRSISSVVSQGYRDQSHSARCNHRLAPRDPWCGVLKP